MPRVRILFSKRGPFCFIRHVELPQIFSRAARRAGIVIDKTEGFSPHPRISLGPALPVGVVACAEPAEIWFSSWGDGYLERMNESLPVGLSISMAEVVEGIALNKLCEAGEYLVKPVSSTVLGDLADLLDGSDLWKEHILSWKLTDDGVTVVLSDPGQVGPGKIVKDLVQEEVVQGWTDLRMARISVGIWDRDSGSVIPLVHASFGEKTGEGRLWI